MKNNYQVAVIGGGVVGCSVLYHLTKAGWKDVILIERMELTSGSSWHAAGGFHTLNGDVNMAHLQAYTVKLYKEIEEISGQKCGLHLTGGIQLADTKDRLDWLKMAHARGRYLGMETEIISAREAHELLPIIDEKYFVGAMYDPIEGNLDPSGTTHAYAKAAKVNGAEIILRNRVIELKQQRDHSWLVVSEQGTICAEHVVNAGGLWAREVGRMAGLELPLLAMEHHYLLTEDMPEVAAIQAETGKELIGAIDFGGEIYTRQERGGMLLGTYEKAATPWSPHTTPWDFGHELLPADIERISPSLEIGFKHFPALQKAGIKQFINGPFTFAPDGNPLMGPVRGLPNFWCACAVMAGFSQGGGVGLSLANWMVDGDPGFDIWAMDVARFGDWASVPYTRSKVCENYSRRFSIRYPNEELPAARPLLTTPLYDEWLKCGAVMGDSFGLEVPLWFAPNGVEPVDIVAFRRSNDFEHVGRECQACRNQAGITEISNFAKYEFTGGQAEILLRRLMAGRIPDIGRIALTPMLSERGKLIGEFTIARLGRARFLVIGSSAAEIHHMRHFEKIIEMENLHNAHIHSHGLGMVGLSLAGPNALRILSSLTHSDISNDEFRFMSVRQMNIGAAPAIVNRISYTGEQGYEMWMKPEYQRYIYRAIMEAGAEYGLQNFGMRALLSMRLEKNFGTWAHEFRPIYGPYEAGLGRFMDTGRSDFIGAEAAQSERREGGKLSRICLAINARDADVIGDEPIWHDGQVVGATTSGGYGHAVGKSLAQGYIPRAIANKALEQNEENAFFVEIIGEQFPAQLCSEPPFDPKGLRMQGNY